MKIEIIILEGEKRTTVDFELKEKNPSFFNPYSLSLEYFGTEVQESSQDLFEVFEESLLSLRSLTKKELQMEIKFHIYFESRLKSKSKARELIDSKNLYITFSLIPTPDPHFSESDFIISYHCALEYAGEKINFDSEIPDELFEKLYYSYKKNDDMRVCLFCKHYDRFPGTSKHPIAGNSVCYFTERKFLKIFKKNRQEFDDFFENLILSMLEKENDKETKEESQPNIKIPKELSENQQFIADGGYEKLIERVINLPRRIPFENCNYWDKL